jgi:GTP-binding protein
MKTPVFKDRVKLFVRAGDGGDGLSTFRREKFIPFGGPSGGDGGDGGDITLVGRSNTNSLLDLYYRPHQKAEHGAKGGPNQRHGKSGASKEVFVPCGTVVIDSETELVVGEIMEDGARLLVAKGGKGGLGNMRFKSATNQAPTEFTEGTPGENKVLWLTLKIISDAGLVGYPNAGKSTLLSKISGAHPKVGAYPFTTLNPIIGTMECSDYRKLYVADIPGLIEGASEGVGLGHDFLKHIERTNFLIFIIDMGGTDGRNPTDDYKSLRKELRQYKAELDDRPFIVVANKMDVPGSNDFLKEFKKETGIDPIEMIAELDDGVDELKAALEAHFFGSA